MSQASARTGLAGAGSELDGLFLGNSELAGLMRFHDWGNSPLGLPDSWPQSLKTAVRIMLTSRQPIWIGWGPELIYLYNDPYKSIIGGKHPWALGRPTSDVWCEIWSDIGPMLATAMSGHAGTYVEAQLLIMERNGYPEETYYTFSYSPIPADDGTAGGIFCANTDDTRRVIDERQLTLLSELATATSEARTCQRACERAAQALATNPRDLTFAMIYIAEPGGRIASLVSATGIARDHPAAAATLSLDSSDPWPIGEVLQSHAPRVVAGLAEKFKDEMPRGAWDVPAAAAVVLPIAAGGETGRLGFVIAGLNPFRLFDGGYAGFLDLVAGQITSAVANAELYRAAHDEIERRRHIEEALRLSEQSLESKVSERTAELAAANARLVREAAEREHAEGRFQHLVQGVRDYALYMLDPHGVVTNWNAGAERIKGYRASEIVGQHFARFYTDADRAAGTPSRALETAAREGTFQAEGFRVRKDGSEFWANVVINPIRDEDGTLMGFAKITRDVTERRQAAQALERAQEQLAQAQKMEGIGQLTGGVAHDFNNLLTVIIGNLESLQRALQAPVPDGDRLARSVENAMRGAQRAASLTQRLLAFSRRQPLDPKPVDAGRLVIGMSELLRRTLGEQVAIETVLAGGLWRVLADPNQLEIGILNLAVNARDAMPNGGKLTIETANAHLDEVYAAAQTEVVPGQYVVISISDTGSGMTKEVQAHAFEPFYTTKDIGHGTGLGLSQVYGFVKQSGGHVKLYSEVELGTTVKLYLPRLLSEEAGVAPPETAAPLPRSAGAQTILVVEDDDDVRANTTGIVRELGYTVLEAPLAATALHLLERHPEIKLLFTDIGLPGGMNGRQLADAARKARPDLKVLFTTGYARNAIVHDGRLDLGVVLIPKPFTYAALAAKLADILDESTGPPRILLVEDEVLVRMVATEQLEDLGYRVETAGSATEAMNKIKLMEGDIALAIVDIGLPDIKGDVLVGELRARHPALPIIVASGYDDPALHQRFAGDSRVTFIRKPYTQDDLRQAVPPLHDN
jgi:PAS domain S-box-containing protein